MNLEQWSSIIEEAYNATGSIYSPSIKSLLAANSSTVIMESLSDEQKKIIIDAIETMTRFFFKKASKGDTFGSLDRIKEQFGATLEENYGMSDGPFMNMARTYWTYQCEVFDLIADQQGYYLSQVLLSVENTIRGLFFPTPGPSKVAVRKRISAQREMLQMYAPDIDIQRFLTESPILKAESRRSGCLASLLIMLVPIVSIILFAYTKLS